MLIPYGRLSITCLQDGLWVIQDDDNDDPDIRSAHSLNLLSTIFDILMTSGKTRARENWNITIVGRRLVDIRENPRNIKELLRVRD